MSDMTTDWQELMIPQHTMRPSYARVSEQLDLRFAAIRLITTPISLHPVARKLLLIFGPTEGRRLSWPKWNAILIYTLIVLCGWRAQVESFVAVVGAGPVRRQIQFWVIALAIVGGCLLLFLIVILLWKVRSSDHYFFLFASLLIIITFYYVLLCFI